MNNNAPRHIVFGTGAIGLATLEALRRRGESVRMVNRSGSARVPEGIEVVGGDAGDPEFTVDVSRGAQVIYQTLNPPYARWTEEFPGLQAGVLAAAEAHGARLVSMENVYMYGRPAGRPLTETRDYAAHTKKGKLRGQMARELLAAHQAGRVQVAIGRASDYFGPRGGAQSNLGDRVFPRSWPTPRSGFWATRTSRTAIPTFPTSARDSPSWASTRTHPGRSGTCPTTRRPGPLVNWSNWPSGRPANPGPGCGRSHPADPGRRSGQPHPARGAGDAVPVRRALHRGQQQDHRATRRAGDTGGAGHHRDA